MAKAKRSANAVGKAARAKPAVRAEDGQGLREARASQTAAASAPADAVLSRARPKSGLANVIRPSRPRSRGKLAERTAEAARREASAKGAEAKPSTRAAAGADLSSGSDASEDPWALPPSVRERFVQDRRRFYFPDGTEAFRDGGRRLMTGSENTEVVRSLVEIAQARGWGEITVEGTERFRREAWRQGRLAQLEVRGYRPSEAERTQVIRALARKAEGRQLELDVTDRAGGSGVPGEAPRTDTTETRPSDRALGGAPQRAASDLLVGTLIDHGPDHYRFDPKEDPSYFVRIKTAEGTRTVWGKDLERAMTHSMTQPAIGEAVGLRRVGAEPVTVRRRERDADGQVVGEHALGAKRHRWVVEKRGFFEERASAAAIVRDPAVNRKAAAGAHPELVGTFLQLRAAELAAQRLRDPEDQRRFVALVRGALADAVERGEPLQPVRLRGRPGPVPQRAPQEREPEPIRT